MMAMMTTIGKFALTLFGAVLGVIVCSRLLIGMFGLDPTETLREGKPAYGMMLQGVFVGTGICIGMVLGLGLLGMMMK